MSECKNEDHEFYENAGTLYVERDSECPLCIIDRLEARVVELEGWQQIDDVVITSREPVFSMQVLTMKSQQEKIDTLRTDLKTAVDALEELENAGLEYLNAECIRCDGDGECNCDEIHDRFKVAIEEATTALAKINECPLCKGHGQCRECVKEE